MTIEQWIETYKPKSYHVDTRGFIVHHLPGLYNVYIWTIVPSTDGYLIVPSKRLASGIMFLVCKEMWDDEEVEYKLDEKDVKLLTQTIDKQTLLDQQWSKI